MSTSSHRVGRLEIGDSSVVIVVASAHRAAAFDACRWIIDTLKKTVPIWKKEFFDDGATWADGEAFPAGADPVGLSRRTFGKFRISTPSIVFPYNEPRMLPRLALSLLLVMLAPALARRMG